MLEVLKIYVHRKLENAMHVVRIVLKSTISVLLLYVIFWFLQDSLTLYKTYDNNLSLLLINFKLCRT